MLPSHHTFYTLYPVRVRARLVRWWLACCFLNRHGHFQLVTGAPGDDSGNQRLTISREPPLGGQSSERRASPAENGSSGGGEGSNGGGIQVSSNDRRLPIATRDVLPYSVSLRSGWRRRCCCSVLVSGWRDGRKTIVADLVPCFSVVAVVCVLGW